MLMLCGVLVICVLLKNFNRMLAVEGACWGSLATIAASAPLLSSEMALGLGGVVGDGLLSWKSGRLLR